MTATIKVWGVPFMAAKQKLAVERHCFGDCAKISMGGVIDGGPGLGGLAVCCEAICPHLGMDSDEPIGTTMSFGKPHAIYLRALKSEE